MKEDSVASEFEFDKENASITNDESEDKDAIKLNIEVALPNAYSESSLSFSGRKNNLDSKMYSLRKGKTQVMDDLTINNITFQ